MPDRSSPRRFSDDLLEAAARVDELSRDDLARLLMKAAVRLRVIQQAGPRLEHVPVAAYELLRRLAERPLRLAGLHARSDRTALEYLVSRQLAELSAEVEFMMITVAGSELGEIAEERAN
jgi:hypothetical protein